MPGVLISRRAAVSLGFPRRAQAGAAVGLAVACLVLNAASASAASIQSQEWWLRALHVTQAWQSSGTRAAGVTIAVLDTGVGPNQADLSGAVVTGPDYTNSGRVSGGPFWGIHGTAMASLIAGRGHGRGNAAGILGVAPAATILSVRVTLESDDPLMADTNVAAGLPSAIARGIRYAVGHHATVIDLPLDPVTTPGAPGVGGSAAEKSAIAYALAHRVVLVAPAGDGGAAADPVNFPAAYPGVISVGAFDSAFTKAPFSSRRPYVTLTAAGVGVSAANGPTGYAQVSSTTAASAVVTGIVALIRAQFPALSPAEVTRALTQSTVFRPPGGQQDGSGAGTVDAAKALAAAAAMVEAVPGPGSSPGSGTAAAQPPGAPAVHSAGSSLSQALLIDVGIAVALFLLLAVPILWYGVHRRRRARAARLAEVRAAAQPVVRRADQSARQPAIATPEPEYSYIPAPPLHPEAATSFPSANGAAATGSAPWAPWGESGPPGSSSPGSAFPGSAFPKPRLSGPAGPVAPAGPPGPGDMAGLSGPAGLTGLSGPGDMAGLSGPAGPAGPAGPSGPAEQAEQAEAAEPGGWAAPAGPGRAGPAHAGPARGGGLLGGGLLGGGSRGGGAGAGPDPAEPGAAAGPLAGPHRTGAPRTPKISGGPPWEPAPEPTGEVPWGRSPVPPPGGARAFPMGSPQAPEVPQMPQTPAKPPEPQASPWDTLAEEAWPGGPGASRPSALPSRPRRQAFGSGTLGGAREPGDDDRGEDPATTSQPIYVWNPGASTENLPAVPPSENHHE
jgi:hypothetical protein